MFLQLDFSQIMTSQVQAALSALYTNFQLPCQQDCYKLLAAVLCSAPMVHKENWQMPGGTQVTTGGVLISMYFPSINILVFQDWDTLGRSNETSRAKGLCRGGCKKTRDGGKDGNG